MIANNLDVTLLYKVQITQYTDQNVLNIIENKDGSNCKIIFKPYQVDAKDWIWIFSAVCVCITTTANTSWFNEQEKGVFLLLY